MQPPPHNWLLQQILILITITVLILAPPHSILARLCWVLNQQGSFYLVAWPSRNSNQITFNSYCLGKKILSILYLEKQRWDGHNMECLLILALIRIILETTSWTSWLCKKTISRNICNNLALICLTPVSFRLQDLFSCLRTIKPGRVLLILVACYQTESLAVSSFWVESQTRNRFLSFLFLSSFLRTWQ